MKKFQDLGKNFLAIDDALIAATSLVTELELMTHNKADFQYIPNIKLYKF
jgi:predicted nucleic acid-binding protein